MKKVRLLLISIVLSLPILIVSCDKNDDGEVSPKTKVVKDYSADVAYSYFNHYLSIIKHTDGYRPPVSARALAYISLSGYESVAPGMTTYQSMGTNFLTLQVPKVEAGKEYHWGVAINTAYQYALRYFLQNMTEKDYLQNDSIANFYDKKYAAECDTATFNRSKRFGKDVSYAVYLYSIEDGQANAFRNNKPTDYLPPKGESLWVITPPDNLNALTPRWGSVRTFIIRPEDKQLVPHIPYSASTSSEFYKQAKEVYDAVKNVTNESKWIAEFWSDDLNTYTIDAAGRWIAISNAFMKQEKANLETVAYVNTKVAMSLHDAAVACWYSKYNYNLLRPVTYINRFIDAKWIPLLRDKTKPVGQQIGVTPQHPSYPSGHSVFGAAAVAVLIDAFGDKINFTDRTHEGETYFDGRPRSFTTFTKMAEENAYSRIPLGVHYRMDCDEGLRLGKVIGQRINAASWKKPNL